MPEEWRPIPGFKGYEASSEGRIRSFWRRLHLGTEPHFMYQHVLPTGYIKVNLRQTIERRSIGRLVWRRVRRSILVSRAVCLAFHGEPPKEDMHASHIDGVPSNNAPSNLMWESKGDNEKRKKAHGTATRRDPDGRFNGDPLTRP
jgi:hypothetical protein